MTKADALQSFWAGFGLPAYEQNTAPSDATYPRLTYEASEDYLEGTVTLTASLWYYSTGWTVATAKATEIGAAIGLGGTKARYDGGSIWIKRGHPFSQRMADPEENLRRVLITVEVEYL